MSLMDAMRPALLAALVMTCGVAWADGDAPKETPSSARMIPIHLGQVDAVTGGMLLQVPVGPRLPGRIPLGFKFTFDSQDAVMSQVGGSLKPVIWPGGSGSPQVTTVVVDGMPWVFQKKAAPAAGSMPTDDQVHQWMLQRGVDDGQTEAAAANDPTTGITPAFKVIEVLPTADGTRFFVRTAWTIGVWKWTNQTKDTVPSTKDAAGRSIILSGPDAIWTGTYMGFSSGAFLCTHFSNKWGDHVSVTEAGGKVGSPSSIVIKNEKSPSEWVRWDRDDTAQTITITSSPTIPLPSVKITGTIKDLEREQNYWSVYPTTYDKNATFNGTGIFDGGVFPTKIEVLAGNESRVTLFTWYSSPSSVITSPVTGIQITVKASSRVAAIQHPSGLFESFQYAKVGKLSTDSFLPPLHFNPGAAGGTIWTGYSTWSDFELPFETMDEVYDPVNPAGAGLGITSITTSIPQNPAAPPLLPLMSASDGQTIVIARKQPSAHSSPTASTVWDFMTKFSWDTKEHTTTILRYPTTSPQISDAYRGVRLTHPSATGPCTGWGTSSADLDTQRAAYLFATSAVIKEEIIHGSGVTPASKHPDDWEPTSPVVDSTMLYDQWDLTCWANPTGALVNGLPVNPRALKSSQYSPTLPGGTSFQSGADAFGPTQQDNYHNAYSGPPPTVTGASAATWNGTGGISAPIYGSPSPVTQLRHTDVVSRHWDSSLMVLLTDSTQKSILGDSLPSLRQGAGTSVDFGTTRYTYDSQGRATSVSGTRGAFVATEVRTFVDGQPLVSDVTKTLTSGGGPVPLSGQIGKSYTYDTTAYRWLLTETDKLDGRSTTILNRDSMGRILRVRNPEGVITSFTYDSWGRTATKTREAKGSAGLVTSTYTYEPSGDWSEERTSYTDADGQLINLTVHTDYDAAGRPVKVTNPDGSYQITQYDGWGQKVLQTPVLKPGQTNYGNYRWSYDAKGRLVASYDPKGRRLSWQPIEPAWAGGDAISGRVVSTVYGPGPNSKLPGDPELPRTVKTDILGQQREVIDQLSQLSTYSYNQDGKLASTNQNGQSRSYSYNDMGWLTDRSEPEEGLTHFDGFTITGMPLVTTQKGKSLSSNLKTLIALNAWGLPAEVQVWNGTALSTDRVLSYDPTTHWLTSLWESQPNGILMESYGYDDLGRVTSKSVSDEGGQSFNVSRTLDAVGTVATLSYPSGGGRPIQVVKYKSDILARPKSVTLDAAYRGQITSYDQVSGTSVSQVLTLGNGASTMMKVDAGELAEVKHSYLGGNQDSFLAWSTGGLLLRRWLNVTATSPTKFDSFTYDALQRLTSSTIRSWDNPDDSLWDTLTQDFTYDRWGNRTSEASNWLSPSGINKASRQKPEEVLAWHMDDVAKAEQGVTNGLPGTVLDPQGSVLQTGRSYDDLGRLTTVLAIPQNLDSKISWTYDASGRVVAENGVTFLLDAQGLRFRRNQADGTQYTVYGFGQEPLSVFLKPIAGAAAPSGGAVATLLPGGGDGGGDPLPPGGLPSAGAFITQPSGPTTVGALHAITFQGTSTYGSVLTWTFGDGGTASGGSVSHTFNAAGTYSVTLTASGAGYATSKASVAITVMPLPEVTALTAVPSTIVLGQSTTLSWSTINATSLSLDNGLGSVTGLSSKTVTPGQSGDLIFTLTATNASGSVPETVTVHVSPSPAPVINSFTATPSAVPAGQPVALKWNVTQEQSLWIIDSATQAKLDVTGKKNWTVNPTTTRTYTLYAKNGSGTVTFAVTVPIIGVPVINRFSAGPAALVTGQSTMLSWDVTGAATLTLSGGGSSWTMTGNTYRIVSPTATTTYTLTASNSAGGVTRQVIVTVSAPSSLAWVRSMVYGLGQLLSEERADVGTVYIQGDQVGSPSLMTDSGGNLVGKSKGLPFGERAWQSGSQSARRFTNHEDQPGSPIYMQARMYLPAYGRFAQPDPAYDQAKLDPESWNLYGYVTNNPVTHTDPDGRMQNQWDDNRRHATAVDWQMENDGFRTSSSYEVTTIDGKIDVSLNLGLDPVMYAEALFTAAGNAVDGWKEGFNNYNNTMDKIASDRMEAENPIKIMHYANGEFKDATEITSVNRFVNGMNNDLEDAERISKTTMAKKDIAEFDLVFIPTLGFAKDLVRALSDKLGFTTSTATQLAGIIKGAGAGNWYCHSYGGVAFAEAVRTIANGGGTLLGQSVTFLAGANNKWVTDSIMRRAGVNVRGYSGSFFDLVPNIIGLNSFNPFRWAGSILASPLLFSQTLSPHSPPPVN